MQVFTAAFTALSSMTVISAVLGESITSLFPERVIGVAAGLLFLVLGAQMVREGRRMQGGKKLGEGEEMREVEGEIEGFEKLSLNEEESLPLYKDANVYGKEKRGLSSAPRAPVQRMQIFIPALKATCFDLATSICSPFWLRTFTITLLAEWGDRSQFSTMAMASGEYFGWVVYGAISGHLICTALAALSGKSIAGRVSMRVGEFTLLCLILYMMALKAS